MRAFLYFCGVEKTRMARNRLNYLLHCKKVVDIVNQHYEEGWTTYAAVWRRYVNPVYPMEAERQAASERDRRLVTNRSQLSLFD